MTGMLLGLTIAIAGVAQAADRSPRAQPPAPPVTSGIDLSSAAQTPPAPPGEKSFGKLFAQADRRAELEAAHQALARAQSRTKIVCGMVVIQADPSIDPKFVHHPPADTSGMKIRRIPPPACAD